MLRSTLLLAAACLMLASPVQAQWKWRDASGKVQYSDLPPPQGVPEKDILQRPTPAQRGPLIVSVPMPAASAPAPASAPASAPAKPAAPSAEQRLKEQNEATKQREEAEKRKLAEQRRDNCTRARESLRSLESGQRMTHTNDKGERVYLDEAQVAAETRRARDIAANECR